MTTTKEDGKLIKVDAIGRVRTAAAQREALLDAYESSGLSGPEFAARHGVKYLTFATWLQKRKRRTGSYPALAHPDGTKAFPVLLAEVVCLIPCWAAKRLALWPLFQKASSKLRRWSAVNRSRPI
ncbi:hypothetical protein OVA24_06825 [Luteolibacter sp. SL250]|uniref:IS66 family insertion sequence element accessory protein TnpA n=1 Tax=Luteolibacter sp. SL250 TaxID=2995170 RepID=UPI00226E9235|nr:hypothetical protein [Luteolibacter sp. SL250]WAC21095.1 hypothetical protein OVA24_06825 [Luteolibacter sp. SL250]